MKRQTQFTGIRNWYGGDLLDLGAEPMKILDGFFTQYGNFILSGCRITPSGAAYDISAGLVALEGKGPDGRPVQIVAPFGGCDGVVLPLYLTLKCRTQEDTYDDGSVQPVAYIYTAEATGIKPAEGYVELSLGGSRRFTDVVQDEEHRFLTDLERAVWNAKESPEGAQAKTNKALKEANSYTDTRTADTLTQAKGYTDTRTADTLKDAKSYTDTRTADTLTQAKGYTDTRTADTLTQAKSYTDIRTADTLTQAKGYTDTETADTLTQAKGYTDTRTADTLTQAKGYTDTRTADTLQDAKSYADGRGTSAVGSARSYTDAAVLKLISSAPEGLDSFGGVAYALNNDRSFSATIETKLRKSERYDFVVNSNEALAALAALTDRSVRSVLIAPGTWTFDSRNGRGISLPTSVVRVVGSPGSELVIRGVTDTYCLGYEFSPEEVGGSMEYVTVRAVGDNVRSVFLYVGNMYSCKAVYEGSKANTQIKLFDVCMNLNACEAYAESGLGFHACRQMYNCVARGTLDVGYNYCWLMVNCMDASPGPKLTYRYCNTMIFCLGNSGMEGSTNVCRCSAGTYVQSYSSPSVDERYKCANTLEGGWNR